MRSLGALLVEPVPFGPSATGRQVATFSSPLKKSFPPLYNVRIALISPSWAVCPVEKEFNSEEPMKKLLVLAAMLLLASPALADDVLVGKYANNVGTVTISQGKDGANYDVVIADPSGKCNVQIQAATNKVTAEGKNGAVFHPNTIVAVEGQTYPQFSLWPEDQTIRLADDALPFDQLDPACQAFKGNMVFTRQQ